MRVDQRKFWMPLLAALCIGGCGAAEVEGGAEYRAVVQQALDAMNAHDMGALRATFGETYVRHCQATPDEVNSVDDFVTLVQEWYRAFPDAVQTLRRSAVEGDLLAFQVTFEGTHERLMNGIPATGKKIVSEAFGFHRFDQNGKIVETWVTWDNLAVMAQLGLGPESSAGQDK